MSRRQVVDVPTITLLYSAIRDIRGVNLMDCSYTETIPMLASLALGHTPVFIVPIHKNAIDRLNDTLDKVRSSVGESKYQHILGKGIIVVSSQVPEMNSGKGRKAIENFLHKVCDETGFNSDRTVHIPYDEGFGIKPLAWHKISFAAKHSVRRIAGMIIDDSAEK